MPNGPKQHMSDGVRTLLVQGAPLYIKTVVALRHFISTAYDTCETVLAHRAPDLGLSIGVLDLASRKSRLHLYPGVDPGNDWDGAEAYIGAKIQLAQYAPLLLFFYLCINEDDDELAWSTGISLGFSSLARRTSVLKKLQMQKDSWADEDNSFGTDSWLLDFSVTKRLVEIHTFPDTLDEVVDRWLENCRGVGGINLDI